MCFKSYRIAFRVALWLDFEQLSSYSFSSYRRHRSQKHFRAAISKCYMEFDTKLEDWMKRYLIQNYQRLSQEYFKSYRIAFRVALWLVFGTRYKVNNYPVTYSFIGVFLELRYENVYMDRRLFGYKLEHWIKRYLIQTYHRLSQKHFKSYRIALRVALWLDFEQLSSYLFISRCLFRAAISKCYMEFDTKLEDWINIKIFYSNLPKCYRLSQ